MRSAVVLLSGGVDSATTMAMARSEGYSVYALSFRYGQRHAVELEAAKNVAVTLGAEKHLVIDFNLREIGGSALTSSIEVPKDTIQNLAASPGDSSAITLKSEIPVTYVPARNTIFLSFALGWAEVLKAADIYIGANAVDYSGYPDCRPEYLKAFENMANLATKAAVEGELRFRINAPLLRMTKAEIVRAGLSFGLDYGITWSCYDPQPVRDASHVSRYGYSPCGRCDSCIFRAKGFADAGIEDPALS